MDKHIRDIINKCEDEAPVLDKVIRDIFMSCDTENEGIVPVSKLSEFIMPFLQGNVHALDELHKSLDPNNINPSIDINTFYKDMNEWTLKISSADHIDEEDIHNVTPRDFERIVDKDFSFLQSTPRSNFGHHLLKGYVESGISNLSTISSTNENQSVYFPDRTVLEEQIQELQHQKRQVNEELMRVKIELTSVTEQNETFQADLDKVLKKLANEQKLNSQLQSERKKEDDCEEELCCAKKQVIKLERSIVNLEKQNIQLQQELDAVIMEKQGLEYQIQRMDRKSEEIKSSMVILQTEIDIRKSEVVSEHKTNEALVQHNQELCDIIEKCIINIDRLKLEKAMLRKFYREKMNKSESLLGVDLSRSLQPNRFNEYVGISQKLADKRRISDVTAKYSPNKSKPFNSPTLLRMLREPVTPTLDSPKIIKRSTNEMNLATMILNRSNTPHLNKQEQRPILDMTPPMELNKIPVLSPRVLPLSSTHYCVGAEIMEIVFERVMDSVFQNNTPNSLNTDSPPVMYVTQRTPENGVCDVSNPSPYSPKLNDSSDEFFFYNYDIIPNEKPNENLLEEMAKATICGIDEESECEESVTEAKHKSDWSSSKNPKTYVTEVHLKLDEYMDLEHKCEALEQKIEELESENSMKDMKICDLNNEIEKLRQKVCTEDKNSVEKLLKKIDKLETEKNIHQIEKDNLVQKIKILNEEKVVLQLSKEELLLKVIQFERQTRDDKENFPIETLPSISKQAASVLERSSLKHEHLSLKYAKEDFECLKLDYEKIKSSMETYQKLNENLIIKNNLLQKTIREKEKLLEDNLEEINQLREVSDNFKDKIHDLNMQSEDYKKAIVNLEYELNRKEIDLQKIEKKVFKKEKIVEDINKTLKTCDLEKNSLNETVDELRDKLREKSEILEKQDLLLIKKEEIKNQLKSNLEETSRKLEQEIKKQDYLCKKFVNLENELIEEKNSSERFKEKCDSLLNDILNFKEMMTKLEIQITTGEAHNEKLLAENVNLKQAYNDKTKEVLALIDGKNFLAKRNEELLQENGEIFMKYDLLMKELNEKIGLLNETNRNLREIELHKLKFIDSENYESDQINIYRKEMNSLQKNRDKKAARRNNFDRLTARNNKLEEKNAALIDQVSDLQERLRKEIEAKNSITTYTNTIKDILYERRVRLGRATESAIEVWRETLEKFSNMDVFREDLKTENSVVVFTGPLDEEMNQLKHQIHLTTVLLSNLTCFINRQMLKKNEFVQTDFEHSIALHKIGEVSTTRMEETFATLILTYTIDKDSLHQRFHNKKIQLGEMERSLGEAVSALTLYLEQNISSLDVSHFMDNILQLCTQVSISAVQYGSLRQQTELTAAAEMMINYVANLKQEIETLSRQLPTIGPTTSLVERVEFNPEDKSSIDLDVRKSQGRRFLSCAKTTCIMFTLSIFVLMASLVLNTDIVFKVHRNPLPT